MPRAQTEFRFGYTKSVFPWFNFSQILKVN